MNSSSSQRTLASKAEKVLATAKCLKAMVLVVGPPQSRCQSTPRGPSSHREAAVKAIILALAEGRRSRGASLRPGSGPWGQAPSRISKVIHNSSQVVPCMPFSRGPMHIDCQKVLRWPQNSSC